MSVHAETVNNGIRIRSLQDLIHSSVVVALQVAGELMGVIADERWNSSTFFSDSGTASY